MTTKDIFREDSHKQSCEAVIVAVVPDGIVLDQTVFYPHGGGQLGDTGLIVTAEGERFEVIDTRNSEGDIVHHVSGEVHQGLVGRGVNAKIDWERRHRFMRMHTCTHLLCGLVSAPVTGCSIRDGSARLDFDMQEPLDRVLLTEKLNQLIEDDHAVQVSWVDAKVLDRQPDLVRTLSVKPPRGQGRVRLVRVVDVDLQPCGGTHVLSTAEIGRVEVKKVEKKGKRNRRVNLIFAD